MKFTDEIKKLSYPSYISELRRPVDPPEYIVKDGAARFGTFNEPLEHINLHDCSKPCGNLMPSFLKSFRLKEWFAYLIDFKEGFILSAVYNTGLMMFNVVSFFDKSTRKCQSNMIFTSKKKGTLPDSLIDTQTVLKAGPFSQAITNTLRDGKCTIKAHCPPSKKHFGYQADVTLTSISMPSVVVMPLGPNKPLYIHKEMFQVTGTLSVDNQQYELDERAICVIDDHKGYYPYHMQYDWISGFKNDEETGPIAFNIVDNQVVHPNDYNENFVWIKGEMHQLPPITVTKKSDSLWHAQDAHGTVELQFVIEDDFIKRIHLPFFKADYRAPFGMVSGFMKDLRGNKHSLDGTFGIGEDLNYKY